MKHRNGYLIANILIIAVGILFIAASQRRDIINTIVFFTGVMFIVPAVISMISLIPKKNCDDKDSGKECRQPASKRFVNWACSIGAIILGIVMCFKPELFSSLYIYIFSLLLVFGGLYHLYMMWRGCRPATFPIWLYILPVALVAGGLVLFFGSGFHNIERHSSVMLITGIGLIIFAVSAFVEMAMLGVVNRRLRKGMPANGRSATPATDIPVATRSSSSAHADAHADAEDADYEEL